MKLLELTDFFTKTKKEYVVVERLIRIEPYTARYELLKIEKRMIPQTFMERLKGEKPKSKDFTTATGIDRNGSRIVLSDSHTFVLETPEEIVKLLADGTKTTEVKGD